MPVMGLDHVNIRTTDIAASARFYVDLFGYEYVLGPLVMGTQAHWLVDGSGRATIHLLTKEADSTSTGPIDHVALFCQGKGAILDRLDSMQVKFAKAENLLPGITQVFLKDPHGVSLELQFKDE